MIRHPVMFLCQPPSYKSKYAYLLASFLSLRTVQYFQSYYTCISAPKLKHKHLTYTDWAPPMDCALNSWVEQNYHMPPPKCYSTRLSPFGTLQYHTRRWWWSCCACCRPTSPSTRPRPCQSLGSRCRRRIPPAMSAKTCFWFTILIFGWCPRWELREEW